MKDQMKYHLHQDGHQITAPGEEKTLKEIDAKHGIKKLNAAGILIKPATVDKYDRVDEEADGKKELDYGREELELIKSRWDRLKKALSSEDAIMEISSQEYQDDEDQDGEQPEEQSDEEEDPQTDPGDNISEEQDSADVERLGDSENEGEDNSEQLSELLRQEGYSEAEIAYIVHNHVMPQGTVDDIKMDGEKQSNQNEQAQAGHELEHKKRMSDLEYDTASQEQGINELDKQHKQRMLDLEYEAAKKEKEMELQFKEKELELKLKHQDEKASHQFKMKKDIDKSRQQDAAKTSIKEKKGK